MTALPIINVPTRAQGKWWLAALLLFIGSAAVVLVSYLQYNWPGRWMHHAAPLQWGGAELKLAPGSGHTTSDTLVIEGTGSGGMAIAVVPQGTFRAEDYSAVKWEIAGAASGQQILFLWRTAERPNGFFAHPMSVDRDGTASLHIARDKQWRGEVLGLALMVRAPLNAPLTIKGVALEPFSPVKIMLHEWFGVEDWDQSSNHFIGGNRLRQWASPLPIVAGVLALAVFVYWGLARSGIILADRRLLWLLVFLAWFMLDMRWQTDLWRKLELTAQRYAGKTWDEKRLASGDGRLFGLMQQVRSKLQSNQSRVMVFADDEFRRGRAAYYLYPFNVLNSRDLFPAAQFRSGDYLVVLGKDDVVFDPSLHLLQWAPQQQLKADLLLLVGNDALLRVR